MAVIIYNALDGSQGFAGFNTVEAIGVANYGSIAAPPAAIPDRVDFGRAPDGAMSYHAQCYQTDPFNVGAARAEITLADHETLGAGLFNAPFWYYWEMYVPSSWPQTGNPYTVMQIHDWPDDGDPPVWPNFELVIRDGTLFAIIPKDYANKSDTGVQYMMPAPAVFDRWVSCALSARWDKASNAGYVEFYYDNRKIDGRYNIRSNRDTAKGPYLRLGVYDVLHHEDFGKLEAWYRNVKWATGGEGYAALAGVSPKSDARFALADKT